MLGSVLETVMNAWPADAAARIMKPDMFTSINPEKLPPDDGWPVTSRNPFWGRGKPTNNEEDETMNTYRIAEINGRRYIMNLSERDRCGKRDCLWFAGYDFMGSVNWEEKFSFDYGMDQDEDVDQIVEDLKSADD